MTVGKYQQTISWDIFSADNILKYFFQFNKTWYFMQIEDNLHEM